MEIQSDDPSLSDIIVQSKWGVNALYQHQIAHCEYYSEYIDIRFYSRNDHVHSFTSSINVTGEWCPISCSICNVTIWDNHEWSSFSNLGANVGHSKTCDFCGLEITEEHTWAPFGTNFMRCSVCRYKVENNYITPNKRKPDDVSS